MLDFKPSPYVNWIKHLADYPFDADILTLGHDRYSVLVHPGHKPLVIRLDDDIYQSLDKNDKTVQLYFYSLAWVIPVLQEGNGDKIDAALAILGEILDIAPSQERVGAWNMLWDDHAICERLCVLLEINKYFSSGGLDNAFLEKIGSHTQEISRRLIEILEDDRWKNNNHRLFHLLAAFIYADYCEDEARKAELRTLIEDFVVSLIDIETGFSLEQSISYCFFDLVIVKKVLATMSMLSAGLDINVDLIEENLNLHMAALSFPDGSLPASGDSPLGRSLSDFQKKFMPAQDAIASCWGRLDRIGYCRGSSADGEVHFLTLLHNAESAHGHSSPLHTDVWIRGFGLLLVDSGGPYKYGSKPRYDWFRAARGHNSLSLVKKNEQPLEDISVDFLAGRSSLKGRATFKTSSHDRMLFAYPGRLMIHELISSDDDWEMYYNFSQGCQVNQLSKGSFEINRPGFSEKILLETNVDPRCLELVETERCTGHGQSVSAPSLVVSSSANIGSYFINFSKFSIRGS